MNNTNNSEYKIDKIIKEIEVNKLKNVYNEYNDVITLISKFIIKKKLILYGGFVINVILPKKLRFYKDYTINDFDCLSKNPLSDSIELAKIIKEKGYTYIKIKKAKHQGTYRVYVYGKQIFDISIIKSNIYDNLLKYSKKDKKNLKHYKDKYNIIPLPIIKKNLYYELSRPEQSGYRWEKIYERLNILNKTYPTPILNAKYECIKIPIIYQVLTKNILEYIKVSKNPVIDSFALKIYKKLSLNCCGRINDYSKYITILSTDYEKTKNDIIAIIKNKENKLANYEIDITNSIDKDNLLYTYYDINIINKEDNTIFNLINIINVKNECFSINNGTKREYNNFTIGSLDTILYFLYTTYIYNIIYINDAKIANEKLYYINEYEKYIIDNINNNIFKRLKSKCYGIINYDDEIKEIWKKKLTLKYIS
jgi:hypothetical protein